MELDTIKTAIEPILLNNGYELVDLEFKKLYGEDSLIVFIYKQGGVDLDDCEKVNTLLDSVMDELDPTNGEPYHLTISSPGLDRPVVTDADFRRNIGEDLEAIYIKRDEKGKKRVHGILKSYDSDQFVLLIDGIEKVIKKDAIKKLQPYIKF